MAQPKVLVTGATGKTGGAVAARLLEMGFPVRALARSTDERSTRLERLGAEVVVGDLYDPDQLLVAMRGVQRSYYCPPFQPYMIQSAAAFAVVAREARLEQVVLLSQWLSSPAHPAMLTRQTWLADNLLAMVPGAAFTIVNPGFFADNYLRLMPFAAHLGVFPDLYDGTRNAPPSNEDIARVVAAALADPARHDGRRYRPTGPDLLSVADMAAILGRVLGRRVRTVPMPFWMFVKAARLQGANPFEVDVFRAYVEDHKQGAFALGAPSGDVLEVTGQPAEPFEATARRYAARPEARRTSGAVLRTFLDFARTPVAPGYDLDRYERAMRFPMPPQPRFSMEDPRWRADHAQRGASTTAVRARRPAAVT